MYRINPYIALSLKRQHSVYLLTAAAYSLDLISDRVLRVVCWAHTGICTHGYLRETYRDRYRQIQDERLTNLQTGSKTDCHTDIQRDSHTDTDIGRLLRAKRVSNEQRQRPVPRLLRVGGMH